jgi:hypothetical protein
MKPGSSFKKFTPLSNQGKPVKFKSPVSGMLGSQTKLSPGPLIKSLLKTPGPKSFQCKDDENVDPDNQESGSRCSESSSDDGISDPEVDSSRNELCLDRSPVLRTPSQSQVDCFLIVLKTIIHSVNVNVLNIAQVVVVSRCKSLKTPAQRPDWFVVDTFFCTHNHFFLNLLNFIAFGNGHRIDAAPEKTTIQRF